MVSKIIQNYKNEELVFYLTPFDKVFFVTQKNSLSILAL